MKRQYYLLLILAAFLVFPSCSTITGEGEVITQPRHISNFHSILLKSEADIYLTQGPWSVEVKGYENLVPLLTTEVVNNQLIISSSSNEMIENNNLEVYVSLPELIAVELKGQGNIKTTSPFTVNDLDIQLRGMGIISLEGSAQHIHCNMAGTGTIKVCEMPAEEITATLPGTGSIYVFAHQSIHANITGTGDIGYMGNASVIKQVTGVGSVFSMSNCN